MTKFEEFIEIRKKSDKEDVIIGIDDVTLAEILRESELGKDWVKENIFTKEQYNTIALDHLLYEGNYEYRKKIEKK